MDENEIKVAIVTVSRPLNLFGRYLFLKKIFLFFFESMGEYCLLLILSSVLSHPIALSSVGRALDSRYPAPGYTKSLGSRSFAVGAAAAAS